MLTNDLFIYKFCDFFCGCFCHNCSRWNPRSFAPPLTVGPLRFLLCFQIALADDRLHAGDVLARLADLAGIFQLFRDRLAAEIEQVLLLLGQLAAKRLGFSFANFFCVLAHREPQSFT